MTLATLFFCIIAGIAFVKTARNYRSNPIVARNFFWIFVASVAFAAGCYIYGECTPATILGA